MTSAQPLATMLAVSDTKRRGRPPKPAPDGLDELRKVARQIARHDTQSATLKARRDQLIRDLAAAGGSHRTIAQAAGVVSQRVAQILQGQR